RLRRQDGTGATPKPAAEQAAPAAQAAEPIEDSRPERPSTQVVAREDKGDDEFGRVPVIRRGKPVQTASRKAPTSGNTVPEPPVSAADTWKPEPPAGVPMAAAAQEEHPMLAKAREATHAYAETMPNYVCQ